MFDAFELEQRRLETLRLALGPQVLQALGDPDVVEVMLNCDGKLWVESLGKMTKVGTIDVSDAMTILTSVSSALGGQLSEEDPFVEGELPLDGERFEGIAPPVVERPIFAIRKKAGRVFRLREYQKSRVLTFQQAEYLRGAMVVRKNILVVGGTGSGKTTFVNALLAELADFVPELRMLIIEDTRELQCTLENRDFLRTTPWTDMARIAKAVKRLRPDSITIGEVRDGGPALALLKEWNTGHPGGFGTVHANSAYGGLTRLDQLIQEVSKHPQRELISEAVNVVVFLERNKGVRSVKQIMEVQGYDPLTQKFIVKEVM